MGSGTEAYHDAFVHGAGSCLLLLKFLMCGGVDLQRSGVLGSGNFEFKLRNLNSLVNGSPV